MKINCIAIDDEPLALDKMKQYIGKVKYLNLVNSFDNGLDALEFLKNNHIDLIFLDIQMEEFTGIQLLESVKLKPKVILTTAYDEYAVKGYELDVSDYLLKPISLERFIRATDKIFNELSQLTDSHEDPLTVKNKTESSCDYIFVKTEYKIQKINISDILFIQGMRDYLQIHTKKEKIMTLLSFEKLLKNLPESDFVRVHKSYVVSMDKIDSVERKTILIKGNNIPIGDSYKEYFYNILKTKNLIS